MKYQVRGIVGRYWRIKERGEKREIIEQARNSKILTYLGLGSEDECSGLLEEEMYTNCGRRLTGIHVSYSLFPVTWRRYIYVFLFF
jgi:hypothetical protein